jgi:CHAT domain-containing protein
MLMRFCLPVLLSACFVSRVHLFITSACQTGLGFLTSEGVYGLQRGIKNAGAGSMVLSMWSVADASTVHLFVPLFRNIKAGMSLRNAFDNARRSLATMLGDDGEPRFEAPYYADAFILIDALE